MEAFPMDSIQQRLSAGLAIKGGGRGSLTRCVGRLGQLIVAQQQQQQETSDDATRQALAREIQAVYVELTKLALLAKRQRAELEGLPAEDSLDAAVRDAQGTVQELRSTHQHAKQTVACQREYEALAKVAATRYPTPRRVSQAQMDVVDKATRAAQDESTQLDAQRQVREKQFAALMQCMADLKQSLTEPLHVEVDANTSSSKEKTSADEDAMDVDKAQEGEGHDGGAENDEDGELYSDL
uniref:Uncharacterized protein n=1 Tax=Amphora coffeiformis TaxID=265554 RepID=A0A7S3L2D8_9STRA|mmetsp:Transcript_21903/g.41465  ORF Transcript_21903/g.41465 Transcript_21903/m.41465 type:complete len:240 (+) Transcript_21903:92-811(+)